MRPVSFFTALCLLGLTPLVAHAQSRQLTCADFVRNANGSWSPLVPVTIGGVTMGPGVAFTPGVMFSGVDLAALLEKNCH
jgi:hypothetical protein